MTPDGKFYVYGGRREVCNLFVVTGLKVAYSRPHHN